MTEFPIKGAGAQWTENERRAAKEWFVCHRLRFAVSLAYTMLRNRGAGRWADAEDCVSEWLSGGVDRFGGLRSSPFDRMTAKFDPLKGSFENFAITSLRLYQSGTYYPRIARWQPVSDEVERKDAVPASHEPPSGSPDSVETRELLVKTLEQMDPLERTILEMAAAGYQHKEVAKRLHINEADARVRRHRARVKARRVLQELESPGKPYSCTEDK